MRQPIQLLNARAKTLVARPGRKLKGRWEQHGQVAFRRNDGAMVVYFPQGWQEQDYAQVVSGVTLAQMREMNKDNGCNWVVVNQHGHVYSRRRVMGHSPGMRSEDAEKRAMAARYRKIKRCPIVRGFEVDAMRLCDKIFPPVEGYRGNGFPYPFRGMTVEQIKQRNKKLRERFTYGTYDGY